MNTAKQLMVTSEETIKNLQNEVLRLKLELHHKERQNGRPPGIDLDETKRDLIADLMTANEELRNQLQEVEKAVMVDAACQTGLDRFGIDRLMEDSLILKKFRQREQQQQERQQHDYQKYKNHRQNENQHQHLPRLQDQQQQTDLPYNRQHPNIASHKHMTLDEKDSLDKLFKLDGLLTIARDKLRAKVI